MAAKQTLVGIEINARRKQIEVKTRQKGSGRHNHFDSLNQAPPDVRGAALVMLREALLNSGYESMAQVEELVTSELVLPSDDEDEGGEDGATAEAAPAKKTRARQTSKG